jgi:diguanylate cyclase (GGDEF)-like protein
MFKVLHIELADFSRDILEKSLFKNGIGYYHSRDIEEASKISERENLDLVIVSLDNKTDIETVDSHLHNEDKESHIPLLIITSDISLEYRKKLFDLGILDYFGSDISPEKLSRYVAKIIRNNAELPELNHISIAVISERNCDNISLKKVLDTLKVKKTAFFCSCNEFMENNDEYDIYFINFEGKSKLEDKIIKKIRETNKDARIIAVSSVTNYKTISNVLSSGADDYILKPFNRDIFLARLKSNLRNYVMMKELERKNRSLEKMAVTDSLTGLYNHNYIFELLFSEVERTDRYKNDLSIIMLDIDYFKSINDTYGHLEGDNVLKRIASVIKSNLRKTDMVGRYGGEEFLIVLTETNCKKAKSVAEKIRKSVENIDWDGELKTTITAGVAQYSGESVISFVNKVDKLLYEGKAMGKNRVVSEETDEI